MTFNMRERAQKILLDVAESWEKDPQRGKKIKWIGFDNTDSDGDDDFQAEDENGEISIENESNYGNEYKHFDGNVDDEFVAKDSDPIEIYAPGENLQPPASNDLYNQMRDEFMAAMGGEESYREMLLLEFAIEPESAPALPLPAAATSPQIITIANVVVPALQANDEAKPVDEALGQCCLCSDRISNAALIPCGHATFCLVCMHSYLNQKAIDNQEPVCPTCNTNFHQVLRLYQ